jgi:hypothetical protein
LTNQVPGNDVGDELDVAFVAPALRADGPDHLDGGPTTRLDGPTLHRYAVRHHRGEA